MSPNTWMVDFLIQGEIFTAPSERWRLRVNGLNMREGLDFARVGRMGRLLYTPQPWEEIAYVCFFEE